MPKPAAQEILDAIRNAAQELGRPPSRAEFKTKSGMTEYQILQHFPSWREAVRAAGLIPDPTNIRLDDASLLEDWGELVRRNRRIPTRDHYRREGKFSPGVFEKHFGPWSAVPGKFSEFAQNKPEWADVLPLLPPSAPGRQRVDASLIANETPEEAGQLSLFDRGTPNWRTDRLMATRQTFGDSATSPSTNRVWFSSLAWWRESLDTLSKLSRLASQIVRQSAGSDRTNGRG